MVEVDSRERACVVQLSLSTRFSVHIHLEAWCPQNHHHIWIHWTSCMKCGGWTMNSNICIHMHMNSCLWIYINICMYFLCMCVYACEFIRIWIHIWNDHIKLLCARIHKWIKRYLNSHICCCMWDIGVCIHIYEFIVLVLNSWIRFQSFPAKPIALDHLFECSLHQQHVQSLIDRLRIHDMNLLLKIKRNSFFQIHYWNAVWIRFQSFPAKPIALESPLDHLFECSLHQQHVQSLIDRLRIHDMNLLLKIKRIHFFRFIIEVQYGSVCQFICSRCALCGVHHFELQLQKSNNIQIGLARHGCSCCWHVGSSKCMSVNRAHEC